MLDETEVLKLLTLCPMLLSHRTGGKGGPLTLIHVGGFDASRWYATQSAAQFEAAGLMLLEAALANCDRASVEAGRLVRREILLDYDGLALSHVAPRVLLRQRPLLTLPDRWYPELVGRVACVNAPSLFAAVYRVVHPWLSEELRARIEVHAPATSAAAVEAFAPRASRPAVYGGSCERLPDDVAEHTGIARLEPSERAALTPGSKLAGYCSAALS